MPGVLGKPAELRRHWFELVYGLGAVVYVGAMAITTVAAYRLLLESHLRRILPQIVAEGLPWLLAFTVVVAAMVLVLGDMQIFRQARKGC